MYQNLIFGFFTRPSNLTVPQKARNFVTPAKVGVRNILKLPDSGFHPNDTEF